MFKVLKFVLAVFVSIVVIALVFTGVGQLFLFNNSAKQQGVFEVAADDQDSPKMRLKLGGINEVAGTVTKYADLRDVSEKSSLSSRAYGQGHVRNILFFNGADYKTHWLLQNHQSIVHDMQILRTKSTNDNDKQEKASALLFTILNQDSNQDGSLDRHDKKLLMMARTDGTGKSHILKDVDALLDVTISSDGNAVMLLLEIDQLIHVYEYSASTFAKTAGKMLLDLKSTKLNTAPE